MEESEIFYTEFLGLRLAMDMGWVLTFVSASNPSAQITIVKKDQPHTTNDIIIEVPDIESMYAKALSAEYEITYPLTDEPW